MASPALGQFRDNVKSITVSQLPATCIVARIYNVRDGATGTDCSTGSGSTAVWCVCDAGGATYTGIDPAASSSGDIGDVGDCASGACFQSETARFGFLAPTIGGVASFRAITEADISDLTHDGTGTDDQTAVEVPYTPTTGTDWTDPDPTEVLGGLDDLAGRLTIEEAAADGHGDGANCSAGSYPLGVDASGAAQSCTDASAEIDTLAELNTILTDATLGDLEDVSNTEVLYRSGGAFGGITQLTYDGTNLTLVPTAGDDIAAEEVVAEVYNDSGATIFKCAAVYLSGFDIPNDLAEVSVADADNGAAMPAVGLVRADIANGAAGFLVTAGDLLSADTATGEAWSVGDAVYVNTSGTSTSDDCGDTLTNVKPTGATTAIQKVGIVSRVNAANGEIEVVGAGRSNDVPNIASANFWLGNGSGVATAVTMSGDATMDNAGAVTIAANSVALTTDTTGNYVSSATASQGLLLTGTEAASLGLIDCAATEILKRNAGDTAWECAADSTGGTPAFNDIASGTNTTAAMVVGTGASLATSGSGTITATTAAALAANGGNCAAGEIALGVDAAGAVEGCYQPVEADITDLSHFVPDSDPFVDHSFTNKIRFSEINYAHATLVSDPGLSVDECFWSSTATGGGFLCEGSVGDTNEQLYLFPDVNGADTTQEITVNDATQTLTNKTINTASNTITVVEADVSDLNHLTEAEARTGLIENGSAEMTVETMGTACTDGQAFEANATGGADCVTTGGDVTGALDALVVGDDSHAHVITNIDAFTVAQLQTQTSDVTTFYTEDTVVPVADGGTGASTFTDGGILLGSGTGAITALGAAANGEIPIGDGTTDPVLATITGGRSTTITNGAGTITVAADAELYTSTKCIIIETPADADNFLWWRTNSAITVTEIDCIVEDATSAVITVQECDANGNTCGTTEAAMTCAVTNTAHASTIDDAAVDAGDWMRLDVGAITGTPGHLNVCMTYTEDD